MSRDFEASVNKDRLLNTESPPQSIFKRSIRPHYYWEAQGEVAAIYNAIQEDLHRILNETRSEAGPGIHIDLCMFGTEPRRARPVIVISSTDRNLRVAARRTIETSGLLPMDFTLGLMRHPPYGRTVLVAERTSENPDQMSFGAPHKVLFDPAERIRLVGMPVYVVQDDQPLRRVTANVVHNGETFGIITAAHAFGKPRQELYSDDEDADNDDAIDMPFETDDEWEGDAPRDLLSLHSDTSPGTSGSDQSTYSSRGVPLSGVSSPQSLEISLGDLSLAHGRNPPPAEVPINSGKTSSGQYKVLGHVVETMPSLDCAIITITDSEVSNTLQWLKDGLMEAGFTTNASHASERALVAWTRHGPVRGTLLETSTTARLLGSDLYERIPKFLYAQEEGIVEGDCGALVTDTATETLYGQIIAVASNAHTRVAYIVPASRIKQELGWFGNWKLLSIGYNHCKHAPMFSDLF
jgi:hypothetical protein